MKIKTDCLLRKIMNRQVTDGQKIFTMLYKVLQQTNNKKTKHPTTEKKKKAK